MKVTKNLDEFYRLNDKDVTKVLLKYFKNVLKYHDIEDIKSEIYERLHKKKYIENYRPLEIHIDTKDRTWLVKPNYAKFSTYICKFIFNYIYAYYNKIKPDRLCLSLDDFNDSYFNEEDNRRLHPLDKDIEEKKPEKSIELKMEIEKVLANLKEKTEYKGTLVCDSVMDIRLAKMIDKWGSEGCSEEDIIEIAHQRKIKKSEMTVLEKVLFENYLTKAKKKGLIKVKITDQGESRYFLNNPERRSLYNLFRYYLKGYRDKEISEKFNMTVAGVGAMKRSLRKEIKDIQDY